MRLCIAILCGLAASAWAHPIPAPAGTYSNLKYIEGEGDVTGLEVTVIPSGTPAHYDYSAVVQIAEGAALPPQFVPASWDGTTLRFQFTYPGAGVVSFVGRLSDGGLTGQLKGAQFPATSYKLPRHPGFWQPNR